jgi:hypothetical protein
LTVLPLDPTSGQGVTVTWTDVNAGDRPTFGSWYDRVQVLNASTGQMLINANVYYDAAALGAIPVDGSALRSYSFTLPHGDAGAGELQVTVITDYYNHLFEYKTGVSHEAGEANNVGGPVHVTSTLALYPDLLVQDLHPDPADGLLSGSQVLLRWNTHNAGSAAVTGSFYEWILVENLTTGSTLRSEVIFYDARTIPTGQGPIDANSSAARQYLYRLPDGPAGAGEIRLTVRTDHYNHLFEHNVDGTGETNNTAAVTVVAGLREYPDLHVVQIDHPVSGLRPGQEIDISWLLANQGTGDTTGDWTDFVYLSDDDQVGNDLFLGQFNATGWRSLPGRVCCGPGGSRCPSSAPATAG